MKTPEQLNVGIVGLGWVAGAHINTFKSVNGAKVTAAMTRKQLSGEEASKQYGTPLKIYNDYEKMLKDPEIHVIDICNWILKAHPVQATATGGRQGRPADDGDCYGNYNVLFRYPGGVDVTFSSTQFAKGWWDVSERFFGTKGTALSPYTGALGIWGDEPWQAPLSLQPQGQPAAFSVTGNFTSNLESADPEKKKAFIESINSGKFHNQADKGAESALSGMMARTAAYTGREVTWDELLKSEEVWDARLNLDRLR